MGMFKSISNAVSTTTDVIEKSMSGLSSTLDQYAREQAENNQAHMLVATQRMQSKVINNITDAYVRMAESKTMAAEAGLNFDNISEEADKLINPTK